MKFSYNWIQEFVEGLDADPRELARLITLKTAECEGVQPCGQHFARVVAARIVSVEPVGGAGNRKAVIDAGRLGLRTVVCGAPNCRPGLITAYAPPGTELQGRLIEKRVIDGVESDGMLASGAELGINRDQQGILEIEAEPGLALPRLQPDFIIEVDNKSLTHRPDLWGHHGMAREVAAITGKRLSDPVRLEWIPSAPAPIAVAIEDLRLCPRYSALVVEGVRVLPSPPWLAQRLEAVGLNPINNIVDVTNYVMAELGQPMHAFDADKLHGGTIFVRCARDGEQLAALNAESYELTPEALVIADAKGPVALAGVIGGLDSGITSATRRVVLESANFQAASIRRTSVRLKLRTDASMRFEKSQDPANTVRALARAAELLAEVSPGCRVVGGLADQAAPTPARAPIELPMDWLERKLGRSITVEQVRHILESLMFGVEQPRPGVLLVHVPSWRATKDISIKDDLVEEVGRMVGYDTIAPEAPLRPAAPPPDNPRRRFHRAVRRMAAAQGFDEVYNYSFISEEAARRFGFAPEDHVHVTNPISSEQSLLRMSLIPGIWKNIDENSKRLDAFRIFEIGFEIHKKQGELPDEIPHLAAAIYERNLDATPFYEGKRLAECLMPGCDVRPAASRCFEHPTRTAEVFWRGSAVGRLFEFHPQLIDGRAAVLDVDLAVMEQLSFEEKRYQPIRRYPESSFDLSVVAPSRTLAADLRRHIAELAGPQLVSVAFLRQYEGPPLPEGAKSTSFRIVVASRERTLDSEEVGAIRDCIIKGMHDLGYETRR